MRIAPGSVTRNVAGRRNTGPVDLVLPSGMLRRYAVVMHRAFAWILAALVVSMVLPSRSARAEPPSGKATPVYVLSIWTNDSDDQADALTQALRSRVRLAPGWSLAETTQSFETLAIALRCPPTPNQLCLDRIGDQLHADHYIWGTMAKQKAGEVTAEFRLWTRGKPQLEASESYSDNLKDGSDDSLRAVAGRIFAKLTSSTTSGTILIHAGTASGTVLVDGVEKAKLVEGVARLDVARGQHSVNVNVTGFTAPAQTVTLADGAQQDMSFALTPSPSPAPAEATPEQSSGEKSTFPVRKVVGYSAVVAGVGLLVAAGIEGANWVSDRNASDEDRRSVPSTVTDVCATPFNAAGADACQKSNSAASAVRLGWIFAGVGAVLTGTGIWLVLSDHGGGSDVPSEPTARARARPKLDVLPALGARSGSVDVRMTF
jgi:hypothetical protein